MIFIKNMVIKMRKLLLKIKRFFFKRITGLNPEDVKRLVYVQKYLDEHNRENIKRYNEYIKEKYESL